MDSPGSTRGGGSSSYTSTTSLSHLPHHLQQPSSSSSTIADADPEIFTSTQNIRPGQTFVSVQTLTKEQFHIAVNTKTKVHDVLWKCGERLSLSEDKLFGLAFRQPTEGIGGDQPRHEYYFLDPAAKIMKYAHKQPRFANWHNRSSENRPILVLYFRVRVYIDQVGLLTCPKAKEHYYLQLKDNFLDHWAGRQSVSEERCWYMAALALITDKGQDYMGYFRAEHYFPLWVINERGLEYIRNNLSAACEDILHEGQEKAMEKFMIEAGRSPFALNCHLYGLRRHKMDNVDNAVLGINAKGIEMCDIGENGDRIPLRSLQWNKVTRLSFDRKKLTILGADGTKMSLYAQTESKAKYLLELCRAVHQTLLVMSHLYATMAPPPKPYQEMSVDGISTTSSTSGIGSGEHDKDCDSLSSAGGERCHGSISSKLRMRIKMDSNLDVKIEKMELEHIRQERAASQSSKASDESDRSRQMYHPANELSNGTSVTVTDYSTTTTSTTTRPSSIDNASQTIESGSTRSMVDVNFNKNLHQLPKYHHESAEMVETSTTPWHHHHATTSSSNCPPSAQTTAAQKMMMMMMMSPTPPATAMMNPTMTRSETRIDTSPDLMNFEIWQRSNLPQMMNGNGAGGVSMNGTPGRFVKKNSAGSRTANAINRVHSMPSHYHVNGFLRQTPFMPSNIDDTQLLNFYAQPTTTPSQPILTHTLSLHSQQPPPPPRPRNPPPYDNMMTAAAAPPSPPSAHGPMAAEAAGGQPSFPPASATPTQFVEDASSDKFQNCPLLSQLWKEHHQMSSTPASIYNGGGLSHQRRPSSCNDLSRLDQGGYGATPMTANSANLMAMYCGMTQKNPFDSAVVQQNIPMTTTTANIIATQTTTTTQTNGNGSASQLISKNFARVEQQQQQHNGNIHLPPPPPYQQPQQLVN